LTRKGGAVPLDGAANTARMARAFGRRLRRARIDAGLKPRDIEVVANVSRDFLREIEAGRANPTFATLSALALVVEVPISTLLALPRSWNAR